MSVTVVGSVALDTVETPAGRNESGLGGAATYFALAAATYTDVHLVGVVGDDFPPEHVQLLESKGIDLSGLERAPGRTFRWSGRYHADVNIRDTLDTQLNVFERFHPVLPEAARAAKYLFLGNIHPSLQSEVLDQSHAHFIGMDTMNLWINTALKELKRVLRRVHAVFVNDSEARLLTGEPNLIRAARRVRAFGPDIIVIKKGEHGAMLLQGDRLFCLPAMPIEEVKDPTGAGDSFAGGFMGYLAQRDQADFSALSQAVAHGSAVASFTCEDFGPARLAKIGDAQINARVSQLKEITSLSKR